MTTVLQKLKRLSNLTRRRLRYREVPSPEEWSDYLNILGFIIPGRLREGNVRCMEHAMCHLPDGGAILEIGSFCGLSTNTLGFLANKHGVSNKIFSCDPWTYGEPPDPDSWVKIPGTADWDELREFVIESFVRHTRFFSRERLPATFEMESDAFFAAWDAKETRTDVFQREQPLGGTLAFCYIDGDHSYEVSRRDFENCHQLLEPGGFLLFDDSADFTKWGSSRVAREVLDSGDYELVARNPCYFFRKK